MSEHSDTAEKGDVGKEPRDKGPGQGGSEGMPGAEPAQEEEQLCCQSTPAGVR